MTMDFNPPRLSREAALDTLAICREKIEKLEREAGRLSAQAALIGGYLEMVEASMVAPPPTVERVLQPNPQPPRMVF